MRLTANPILLLKSEREAHTVDSMWLVSFRCAPPLRVKSGPVFFSERNYLTFTRTSPRGTAWFREKALAEKSLGPS